MENEVLNEIQKQAFINKFNTWLLASCGITDQKYFSKASNSQGNEVNL